MTVKILLLLTLVGSIAASSLFGERTSAKTKES
jgi:hypothetical protein